MTIDPNELDTALERDRARTATLAKAEADQRALRCERESRLSAVDLRAIERAENEGMVGGVAHLTNSPSPTWRSRRKRPRSQINADDTERVSTRKEDRKFQ